jgi:hypothetical protein
MFKTIHLRPRPENSTMTCLSGPLLRGISEFSQRHTGSCHNSTSHESNGVKRPGGPGTRLESPNGADRAQTRAESERAQWIKSRVRERGEQRDRAAVTGPRATGGTRAS